MVLDGMNTTKMVNYGSSKDFKLFEYGYLECLWLVVSFSSHMMVYNDNKFLAQLVVLVGGGSPLICDKNRRNLDFATIPYLPRALLNH